MPESKFNTITSEDWKRAFERAKEPNAIKKAIHAALKEKGASRPTTDEIMARLFPNDPYERQ